MTRTIDAQILGPLLVFGAFAASDLAGRLLETYPGSALAWYLNLDVFYTFEAARLTQSPLTLIFGPYGLLIDTGLIAAVVLARLTPTRLIVAFLANLGFAALLMLIYCRLGLSTGQGVFAWAVLRDHREGELALGAMLLIVSFVSFALSHLSFVVAIIRESGHGRLGWTKKETRHGAQLAGSMC